MPSAQTQNKNDTQLTSEAQNSSAGASAAAAISSSSGIKTPQESPDYIKQALSIVEKKVRNLEKRQSKLEEYKDNQNKGKTLNADQLLAVSKYDEVKTLIELLKDVEKQMVAVGNDAVKLQKKQAKREQQEREELFKERLKEVRRLQALYHRLHDDNVREDFKNGRNNATTLTQNELDLVDEFYKLTTQVENTKTTTQYESLINESVEHYINLIESKNKQVLTTTYSELKKLFDKISQSTYWQNVPTPPQQQQQQTTTVTTTTTETINVDTTSQQQQEPPKPIVEQPQQHTEQLTQQQITNQDVENNLIEQQQNESKINFVAQQHDPKAFFTTLSPSAPNYIHEVLNENSEFNFLQDSQLQQQQQPQQQQSQPHDQQQNTHNRQHFNNNTNNNGGNNNDFSQNNQGDINTFENATYNNQNQDNTGNQYHGFKPRSNDGGYRNGGGNYRRGAPGGDRGRGGGFRGGPRGGGFRGGENRGPRDSNRGGHYEKKPYFGGGGGGQKPRGGQSGGPFNNNRPHYHQQQQQQQENIN